jgi:hypothetical protein
MTAIIWKPNGERCPDTNVVTGNGIMGEDFLAIGSRPLDEKSITRRLGTA